MKKSLTVFIALVILVLLAYVIWGGKNTISEKHPPTLQEIKVAAIKAREAAGGFPSQVEACYYNNAVVMKIDMRPVDGSLVIYNMEGSEIGSVSSGFGGPVQSTIDLDSVIDCEVVINAGAEEDESVIDQIK